MLARRPSSDHIVGAGVSEWLEQALADERAVLASTAGAIRARSAARLAGLLVGAARDEEADVVLAEALRDAARSRDPGAIAIVEIALATASQLRDDDARARGHLVSALAQGGLPPASILARAWLVDSRLARVEGRSVPVLAPEVDLLDDLASAVDARDELGAELALERTAVARDSQEWPAARTYLERARGIVTRLASPRFDAWFDLEAGQLAADGGEFDLARELLRSAIQRFGACALRRGEARAIIRYAELVAANSARAMGESAPSLLGRAQLVLGTAATWRDRLWIRTGFRNFGRRVFDRVMTEGTVSRIEAFERARGMLISAAAGASDANDRGLTEIELAAERSALPLEMVESIEKVRLTAASAMSQTASSIAEVDRSVRDLIDLIGAALVERDRLRVLINVLAEIDAVRDLVALPAIAARLAARVLEADHVVVALDRDGTLSASGRFGEPSIGDGDTWRATVLGVVSGASPRRRTDPSQLAARSEEGLCGPILAVELRGGGLHGALYADKLRRAGQFRDQDHAIAHLLADYVALALGRLDARDMESFALHQLAVTLDAIRDGVVACDERGIITSMNAAAARMLRVAHDACVGSRLDGIATLAPLQSLVTASPRVDGAVVRLAHGSFVVTSRPIGGDDHGSPGFVATLVELDRAQKIAQRITATRARYGFRDIVGTSAPLLSAVAMARRAGAIDASVLITGESGTGKEVIAQAIHTAGPRANEPFVGINCAALPRELLEAELFGYEKGAFTGARAEGNAGKFELAGEGTILLDEIGDMPLDMQAKLLRVLQERVVTRLGGRQEIAMRARVVATTHRDLQLLVDEGKFRMDLLYRLRVLAIEMPPLRDRPEDIQLLARHYMLRFADQQRKRLRDIGPRVLDELERYDWPGNVRELANVMEAEVSLAPPDAEILERLVTRLAGRFRTAGAGTTGEWRAVQGATTGEWKALPPSEQPILPLAEVEKRAFLHALERSGQSVSKASEALGVSKVTFYAKLRSWGMHPRDRADEEGNPASARWSTRIRAADSVRSFPAPSSSGDIPVAPARDTPDTPKRRG
jgi:transcriptional regulator with PAS, ATPase and Fis domain